MVMPVLASKSAMVALNLSASCAVNGPVAVTVLPLNSPAIARSSKDLPEVAVVAAVVAAAVAAVVAAGAVVGAVVAAGALVSVAAGAEVAGAVVGCGTAVGAGVAAGEHAPNINPATIMALAKWKANLCIWFSLLMSTKVQAL